MFLGKDRSVPRDGGGKGWRMRFNLVVLAAMVLLSILLGALNNLRVDEEKSVDWFGAPNISDGEDVDA